jgi:glycosyltransferase involved in cell wall biosynthesis
MRIAFFSETFLPKWDGVANTMCHLLEHLAKRGHESLMFAPIGAPDQYAATPIIGLPSFPCPFYADLKLVAPTPELGHQVLDFQPDIIHLVNPALMALAGLKRAQALNVPVLMSYHTDLPGYTRNYGISWLCEPAWTYFRWLHNQADLNVSPSRYTRDELLANGFKRVEIWGRGVDTEQFNPAHRNQAMRERLSNGRPQDPLLLYVGRLATEKSLEILRPVLDVVPEANLAFVGGGPLRAELEQLFTGKNVHFTGYLQGRELAEAYAAADLFLFPSTSETFGNVVLEAMASGLPVLAANAGGPVDHVHAGRNGYLFPGGDSQNLATRIRWLLGDPDNLALLGAGARAYAKTQTWESIHDSLLDKYEALVAAHTLKQVSLAS